MTDASTIATAQISPTPAPPAMLEQWRAEIEDAKAVREQNRAGAFAVQLAKAQAQFKPVKRTRTVRVRMKSGGEYEFSYAPLDVLLAATLPALNAEGLALTQAIVKGTGADYVRTELVGANGSRFNMTPIFPGEAGPQSYNSALTYARRAGATLILGVAAEEDNDANESEGNEFEPVKKGKGPKAPASGTRVVLDPGETSHQLSAEDQLSERAVTGRRQQADAFPVPVRAGKDPYGRRAEQPTGEPTGEELITAEGRIADAIQEFHEAALEGRRGGIESIWAEIKADEFVATQTWQRLKERFPDSFATVQSVLKPERDKPQPARGPKK